MNLWQVREKSLAAVTGPLRRDAQLFEEELQLLEYAAQALGDCREASSLALPTALIAAKARSLGICCYSLYLDGHGQEAGALGRVLLEAIELLAYLEQDPGRVAELVEKRLPSAGVRAKKIGSIGWPLREYWNENASHMSMSTDSLSRLYDSAREKVDTRPAYKEDGLHANLAFLFVMLYMATRRALECLASVKGGLDYGVASRADDLWKAGREHFGGDLPNYRMPE